MVCFNTNLMQDMNEMKNKIKKIKIKEERNEKNNYFWDSIQSIKSDFLHKIEALK